MSASIEHDLNDVLFFTKVVSARSFTAAANELGVPNSTVSRRVSRLEARLGVRLLHRTTRKLSVTDAGQLYYERGVAAIAGLEEAENLIAEGQATPKGRVRVVAPVEQSITVRLVTDFLVLYPEVRVDLEFSSRDVNIIQDGYDVSIGPGPIKNLSVVAHKLMDSPIQMVASPAYLEENGTPTRLAHLADHRCIVFGATSSRAHWNLRSGGKERRIPIRGQIAVNHMQAVREAALAGLGIALLPSIVCADDLKAGSLRGLMKSAAPPAVPLYVCFGAGRFLAPAVRAFVDYTRENFQVVAMQPLRDHKAAGATNRKRKPRRSR